MTRLLSLFVVVTFIVSAHSALLFRWGRPDIPGWIMDMVKKESKTVFMKINANFRDNLQMLTPVSVFLMSSLNMTMRRRMSLTLHWYFFIFLSKWRRIHWKRWGYPRDRLLIQLNFIMWKCWENYLEESNLELTIDSASKLIFVLLGLFDMSYLNDQRWRPNLMAH